MRALQQWAAKRLENPRNGLELNRRLVGGDDRALAVAGLGAHAESQYGAIALVGIEQAYRKLRRFAETHRQQSAGQRVECAGMTGFFGIVGAPDSLQNRV